MTVTKEAGHGTKPRKPARPPDPSSTPNETELPEPWSVQRKSEHTLRWRV